MLAEARRTLDQIDVYEAVVAKEGPMVTTKAGTRVHPAEVEVRLLRAGLLRLLDRITLSDTGAAKNVVRQRTANLRWTRERQRREANAARAAEGG